MNALPKTLELVGIAEIAEMAGTRGSAVINWRKDHENFPKPVAILRAGPVFWKIEIETWLDVRQNNPKLQRYIARQKNEGTRYPKSEFVGPPKPFYISKKLSTSTKRKLAHAKIDRDHEEIK